GQSKTFLVCCSPLVERPTSSYQIRGVPLYLQKPPEDLQLFREDLLCNTTNNSKEADSIRKEGGYKLFSRCFHVWFDIPRSNQVDPANESWRKRNGEAEFLKSHDAKFAFKLSVRGAVTRMQDWWKLNRLVLDITNT
ncbi:hypothetical protein GBF38_018198, partial [Nibea albiflora]